MPYFCFFLDFNIASYYAVFTNFTPVYICIVPYLSVFSYLSIFYYCSRIYHLYLNFIERKIYKYVYFLKNFFFSVISPRYFAVLYISLALAPLDKSEIGNPKFKSIGPTCE